MSDINQTTSWLKEIYNNPTDQTSPNTGLE